MQTILIRILTIILMVVGVFVIKLIKDYLKNLKEKTDNQKVKNALDLVGNIIEKCVLATNQTFVNDLKQNDKFGKAEARLALNKTLKNVESLLNEETKTVLNKTYNDVNKYLKESIETEVIKQK